MEQFNVPVCPYLSKTGPFFDAGSPELHLNSYKGALQGCVFCETWAWSFVFSFTEIVDCYVHHLFSYIHAKGEFPFLFCFVVLSCVRVFPFYFLFMLYSLSQGSKQSHTGIISSLKTKGIGLFQESNRYDSGPSTHCFHQFFKIPWVTIFTEFYMYVTGISRITSTNARIQ